MENLSNLSNYWNEIPYRTHLPINFPFSTISESFKCNDFKIAWLEIEKRSQN